MALSLSPVNQEQPSFIVLGDQYLGSDNTLTITSSPTMLDIRGLDFICDSILKLSGEEELLHLKNRMTSNKNLYKTTIQERLQKKGFIIAFSTVLPLVILFLLQFFVFIRRSRKLIDAI